MKLLSSEQELCRLIWEEEIGSDGSLEKLKSAIDSVGELNYLDEFGKSPLYLALERGKPLAIRALCARGASKEFKNSSGETPLDLAMKKNVDLNVFEERDIITQMQGLNLNEVNKIIACCLKAEELPNNRFKTSCGDIFNNNEAIVLNISKGYNCGAPDVYGFDVLSIDHWKELVKLIGPNKIESFKECSGEMFSIAYKKDESGKFDNTVFNGIICTFDENDKYLHLSSKANVIYGNLYAECSKLAEFLYDNVLVDGGVISYGSLYQEYHHMVRSDWESIKQEGIYDVPLTVSGESSQIFELEHHC